MATQAETSTGVPAPDPDDTMRRSGRLSGRTWKYVAGRTIREFSEDQGPDSAAALTYYAVLSLFPALIAVFSLLVAGALVIADLVDGNAVGGPIGFVIAAFFVLNAGVRIVLWRAAERQ